LFLKRVNWYVEILKEVRSADYVVQNTITQAALTSAPLTDILNGKFDISDPTDPNYGWTTRGAATVLSKEAVLTEDSPLNSEFKQTFTVPQGAKYLEFTLKDTTLGNDSALAPGDANEKTSLVDTNIGLTRTDAFLNIQHDGHMYYGSNLIVPKTTTQPVPMTFKVDLSGIQAGTTATLYFDLLGFGNRDAKVTVDDVQLLNNDPVPPVANNDTASTDAGLPVVINVQANDTSNQTIDPTSIAITTNPTQGTIVVNKDGTLAYTPNNNFVGTDTFTYTVANNDGTTSDPATVTVTVNDVAPQITDLPVPKKVYQLDPTNFTATATTTGDNHLTYIWDFGDGTDPVTGNTVQHTFTSSGEYQTTLTVVDAIGLKDTKTVTVYVGSTAPTSGDDPTLPPGFGNVAPQITDLPVPKKVYSLDPTNFSATATSPLGEPLTYTWDFGDGTDAVVGQSVNHIFVASGQYNATLTVTDDFGFSDTKTVTVYVGSTAPTENDDSSLPDWNGDFNDIFKNFGDMS